MSRVRLAIACCVAVTAAQLAATHSHAAVPVVESTGTPAAGSRSSGSSAPAEPTGTQAAGSRSSGSSAPEEPTVRSYGVDQAPTTVAAAEPPSGAVGSGGASELFMRFQQLEADVAQLRGLVEEQNHRIEQLAQQQKEQYMDLDRRIALVMKGGQPATGVAPPDNGDGLFSGDKSPVAAEGGAATGSPSGSLNERDAYNAAFELTKQKRYQQAIDGFNELLVEYPNGQYSGNAFYWLGELYLALPEPNLEKARQSFMQVINLYPNNPKVGDSLYKLGIVYHRLGDRAQALGYLDRVQAQYPGTAAARLAQSYATELR
jgi:tol-pal system protein YbgF